jgi:hypothetical protein
MSHDHSCVQVKVEDNLGLNGYLEIRNPKPWAPPGAGFMLPGNEGMLTESWNQCGLWSQVLPKRTNFPGISSTDRGGLRFYPGPRATTLPPSSLQDRPWIRARGRGHNQ